MAIFTVECEKHYPSGTLRCLGEALSHKNQQIIVNQEYDNLNQYSCSVAEFQARDQVRLTQAIECVPYRTMVFDAEAINNSPLLKSKLFYSGDLT